MMQQEIVSSNCREQAFVGLQGLRHAGGVRLELQVGAVEQVRQGHQTVKVERTVYAMDVDFRQVNCLQQVAQDVFVHAFLDLQANGRSLAQVVQLLLYLGEQVDKLFLVDVEVAVAGDAKGP